MKNLKGEKPCKHCDKLNHKIKCLKLELDKHMQKHKYMDKSMQKSKNLGIKKKHGKFS